MATIILRIKKEYTAKTKLIPLVPDIILRSYEVKWLSVLDIIVLNIIFNFITSNP